MEFMPVVTDDCFHKLFNRLQKKKGCNLTNYFHILSKNFNVDVGDVACIGLTKILEISRNVKILDEESIERYIWKTIRNSIIHHVKKESSAFKFWQWKKGENGKYYKSKEAYRIADLDYEYGVECDDLDLICDINRMFDRLDGIDLRVANLIYFIGNKANKICNLIGISRDQYNASVTKMRFCYLGLI